MKRKRKSYLDPDFDSEEEFGSDVVASEDGSDIEYDDGKVSEGGDDDKDAAAEEPADSESMDSDLVDDMSDEEGELEMSEMDEAGESELSEQVGDDEEEDDSDESEAEEQKRPKDEYAFERDDEGAVTK